jgi:hypothetical protein
VDSKQITELMWKCISDASTALQKGSTFYLAVVAGTTGYLLSATLQSSVKAIIFYVSLSISVLTAIAAMSLGYGLWMGLKEMLQAAITNDDATSYKIFELFVQRGRYVGVVLCICLLGILTAILAGLVLAAR